VNLKKEEMVAGECRLWCFFKAELDNFVISTGTLTVKVDSIIVKNVNQFTSRSGGLCLKFRQVPGALLVTDMHKANVSNVFVDRLYDICRLRSQARIGKHELA
jgi:hypothetical protein